MDKIVVTGCSGFIGSHLTEALLNKGYTVIGIDNLSNGSLSNLKNVNKNKFFFLNDDIKNYLDIERIFYSNTIDAVFHLAALGSVPRSIEHPHKTFYNNVMGTNNILDLCKIYEVGKIIFASSSSVYGLDNKPLSPYAQSKKTSEEYINLYKRCFDLNSIVFRFFNVFGPRQKIGDAYSGVIPNICEAIIKNKTFKLYGDGSQSRSFTYIDDVVSVLVKALEELENVFEPIDLCGDYSIPLIDIVNFFKKETKLKVEKWPERLGDIRDSSGNFSDLEKLDLPVPEFYYSDLVKTLEYYTNEIGGNDVSWDNRPGSNGLST